MTAEAAIELEVWCLEAERQEKFDQVEAVTEAGAERRAALRLAERYADDYCPHEWANVLQVYSFRKALYGKREALIELKSTLEGGSDE